MHLGATPSLPRCYLAQLAFSAPGVSSVTTQTLPFFAAGRQLLLVSGLPSLSTAVWAERSAALGTRCAFFDSAVVTAPWPSSPAQLGPVVHLDHRRVRPTPEVLTG